MAFPRVQYNALRISKVVHNLYSALMHGSYMGVNQVIETKFEDMHVCSFNQRIFNHQNEVVKQYQQMRNVTTGVVGMG